MRASGRKVSAWLPVVLWMGVIFTASTHYGSTSNTTSVLEPLVMWVAPDTPPEQFDQVHHLVRKAAHFTEYAVLALLALRALRMTAGRRLGKSHLRAGGLILLFVAAYASTDEYHQSLVTERGPSVYDVLIDTSGALAALTVLGLVERTKRQTKENSPAMEPVAANVYAEPARHR